MHSPEDLKHNPLVGIIFMILGTILFSVSDAIGKWLTESYPVMQVAWMRSVLGILLIGSYALISGNIGKLKTRKPGWHLLRSTLSMGLLLGIFYSLKYIPLAEYVSITFAAPFIIAILSPWLLKEKVSIQTWLAIVIGFTGIIIVLRPTPDHFHLAHLASLSVAISIAVLVMTARFLSSSESGLAMNFYVYPVNIIFSAFWTIPGWVMPDFTDGLLFFAQGAIATAALGCINQAMRYAPPALVMPIDYSRMIWMLLLGYLIWGDFPKLLTWVGMVFIVVSGIYVVTHGKQAPKKEMAQENIS